MSVEAQRDTLTSKKPSGMRTQKYFRLSLVPVTAGNTSAFAG